MNVITAFVKPPASAKVTSLVMLLTAFGIVIMVPFVSKNQLVTGTVVNATLLFTAYRIGALEAMIIGLIPSMVSLSSGLLPISLAPIVPYIMTSNALYIYVFHRLYRSHLFLAGIAAAVIKAGFLFTVSRPVVSSFLVMMSWPQLATAIMGAGLAILLILRIKR